MSTRQKQTLSQNSLEPIVAEAVDRHISQIPPKLRAYVNRAEAIALALKSLPVFSPDPKQGNWHSLQQQAQEKFLQRIPFAVWFGVCAAVREPLELGKS